MINGVRGIEIDVRAIIKSESFPDYHFHSFCLILSPGGRGCGRGLIQEIRSNLGLTSHAYTRVSFGRQKPRASSGSRMKQSQEKCFLLSLARLSPMVNKGGLSSDGKLLVLIGDPIVNLYLSDF